MHHTSFLLTLSVYLSFSLSLLSFMLSPSSSLHRQGGWVLYQGELVSYPVNKLLMGSDRQIMGGQLQRSCLGDKDKPNLPPPPA